MNCHPPASILRPRRILVRGVNWLGDAVMITPALLRLREKFPEAHITLLTPEKLKDLWRRHPAVNETILFEAGEGQRQRHPAGRSGGVHRSAEGAIFARRAVLPYGVRQPDEGVPLQLG